MRKNNRQEKGGQEKFRLCDFCDILKLTDLSYFFPAPLFPVGRPLMRRNQNSQSVHRIADFHEG
jgi:hypothetical protein